MAIDVLVCPSTNGPAHRFAPEAAYGPMGTFDGSIGRFTMPFDFNGAPTISLPCGLNSEGIPLSIQFVGKHLTEPLLVQVGHAYENAAGHRLRPDI